MRLFWYNQGMTNYKPAILIPVYNHGKACAQVVDGLETFCKGNGITIILVDDGNADETKKYLSEITEKHGEFVKLIANDKNYGKGVAFRNGMMKAEELGFTHVLQLDADGQHDSSRCAFFFEKSRENPEKLICGYPEFDESAPEHRKGGHRFANGWCAIVTWSNGIVDSLCGFRIYPVKATCDFLRKGHIDSRMGFDIDILIKLIWKGVKYEFYPVKVTYPTDGVSNFHPFRDNVRISWVFTKFFVGMIFRSPILLWRKINGR